MSGNLPSNVRVSVHFTQSTVFAGEDVDCVITFKSVARQHNGDRSPSRQKQPNGFPIGERQRKIAPLANSPRPSVPRSSSTGLNIPPHLRKGHKPSLSRDTSPFPSRGGLQEKENEDEGILSHSRPKHGRSLSIISMGTSAGAGEHNARARTQSFRKNSNNHSRSTSLQAGSRPANAQQIPTLRPTSPPWVPREESSMPIRPVRRSPRRTNASESQRSPGVLQTDFKFPPAADTENESQSTTQQRLESAVSPGSQMEGRQLQSYSPRPPEEPPPINGGPSNPIARILTAASVEGTPRSSMDLYSTSNHSTETLASEYAPQPSARLLQPGNHVRQASRLSVPGVPKEPETLMMGYAQVMGYFTLDGSLVNQAPFEDIKRKGVVGGQGGGGVVGVERSKRETGIFGAFGWSNIGESLNGLLNVGEMSSIKEMNRIASSKSIPLINTTQSILFVDLKLPPGESRSYRYTFTLPRGLPPSHKGRAMKVSYNLTVGIQRPGGGKERQVKSIEIPFRVFGSVDSRGEILGHDLMSPYIILRDTARTSSISQSLTPKRISKESDVSEFFRYVTALLEQSSIQNGLLSPTSPPTLARRKSSVVDIEPRTQKDAIDFAILHSNHPIKSAPTFSQLTNRFTIARNNQPVATLLIPRPAYRLGETITLVIDFKDAALPTYSVQVALESSERVDPAIAMRSSQSIYRYTRKVHAYAAESSIFAKRLSFGLSIPGNATPEFVTSGVGLEWKLRVEFATTRMVEGTTDVEDDDDEEEDEKQKSEKWLQQLQPELLEETSADDRGAVLRGVERMHAETFEVSVPVRVYGAVVGRKGEHDVEELNI